jgi:hypothetical protein
MNSWSEAVKKKARLLHYFRKEPSVRLQLVQDLSARQIRISDDFSPLEMVAVFCLLLAQGVLSETIQTMTEFSNEGWAKKFDDDFFSALAQTLLGFRSIGLRNEANELLRFGEATANYHRVNEWANCQVSGHRELFSFEKVSGHRELFSSSGR